MPSDRINTHRCKRITEFISREITFYCSLKRILSLCVLRVAFRISYLYLAIKFPLIFILKGFGIFFM